MLNHLKQLDKLNTSGLLWQAAADQIDPSETEAICPKRLASFKIADIDQCLPFGGLQYGGMHEFFYVSKSYQAFSQHLHPHSITLQLIRNNLQNYALDFIGSNKIKAFNKYIAWIGEDCFPYPGALFNFLNFEIKEKAFNFIENCIFLKPKNHKDYNCCLEAALQSSSISIIITRCDKLSFASSQKLALLAKKHDVLLILYRSTKELDTKSFAATRWQVTPENLGNDLAWSLELLQCKGRKLPFSSWIIEQKYHSDFSFVRELVNENGIDLVAHLVSSSLDHVAHLLSSSLGPSRETTHKSFALGGPSALHDRWSY